MNRRLEPLLMLRLAAGVDHKIERPGPFSGQFFTLFFTISIDWFGLRSPQILRSPVGVPLFLYPVQLIEQALKFLGNLMVGIKVDERGGLLV